MQLITDKQLQKDLRNYKPDFRLNNIMRNYNEEAGQQPTTKLVARKIYSEAVSTKNYNRFIKQIRSKKNELSDK